MKKYLSELIFGTALLHTVVGLLLGWDQLRAIASSGFINAIDPHFDRVAIFWFLSYGLLLFVIGGMVKSMQQSAVQLPSWLPWVFWGMAIPSVILMPISGFWLLFPIGWFTYKANTEHKLANLI